jgi:pimeloyl-ACP methyl ester carboxylesterase
MVKGTGGDNVREAVFKRAKRLERDGVVLEYGVAGPADGPVLLLLHAIRNTRLLFAGIVPRLAEGYRVIAPVLRGHGNSSRQGPYTFERISAFRYENEGEIPIY